MSALRLLFIDLLWGIVPESTNSQIHELKLAAISYSKLKDYKKAEKSIRKALELKPDSKNLNHELAKIFLRSKDYVQALKILHALDSKIKK